MERVEIFVGVMGGKPAAGSPRSAAVWWKAETRWSRFPVVGRGERGAGVPILEGPPWWEAISGGKGGDVWPNNEDERCGRGDRTQNDVVLRNVGGGKEGSGSVANYCHRVSFLYRLFTPTTLTLVTHNLSHAVL